MDCNNVQVPFTYTFSLKMNLSNLTFLSLNVRGIRGVRKRNTLFQWLNNQEIDIILLQETFFTKEMECKIQQEWKGKCFHSYGTNHSRGVSILIKTNIDIVVESYFTSNEGRYVMTNLTLDDRKICVVNVYLRSHIKTVILNT